MDERNTTLHSGLSLMYRGGMVIIAATLCLIIPVVNIFALAAMLVGVIMNIVGLVKIRHIHSDYMSAVMALVAGFVVGLFAGDGSSFARLMEAAETIIGLLQYYYVIRATNSLLREVGQEAVAAEGDKAWKYEIITTVMMIVCTLLAIVLAPLALIGTLFTLLFSIAALIIYMGYLKKSMDVFG